MTHSHASNVTAFDDDPYAWVGATTLTLDGHTVIDLEATDSNCAGESCECMRYMRTWKPGIKSPTPCI